MTVAGQKRLLFWLAALAALVSVGVAFRASAATAMDADVACFTEAQTKAELMAAIRGGGGIGGEFGGEQAQMFSNIARAAIDRGAQKVVKVYFWILWGAAVAEIGPDGCRLEMYHLPAETFRGILHLLPPVGDPA